jgi:hypothetical protein
VNIEPQYLPLDNPFKQQLLFQEPLFSVTLYITDKYSTNVVTVTSSYIILIYNIISIAFCDTEVDETSWYYTLIIHN